VDRDREGSLLAQARKERIEVCIPKAAAEISVKGETYSGSISADKAMAVGFQGFIMKPFTVREGTELVRRVMDQQPSN
jgi:hypothetical protein